MVLGLLIPFRGNEEKFIELEHSLKVPVNFIILPIFAFVNTGIGFSQIGVKDFYDSVTLGVALGLFVGKQVGVYLFSRLAVALRLGTLPESVTWQQIYGVALLSGIGFTMSLFIGSLAFEEHLMQANKFADERLGIILGSLASGVVGFFVLKRTLK